MNDNDIFQRLFMIIESRKSESPEKSYVSSLMTKGIEKINSKIMEEAAEVCEAGIENDPSHTIYEICDLLFHTFVLAGYRNISLQEIRSEMERRFGTSGLEEKAGRKGK